MTALSLAKLLPAFAAFIATISGLSRLKLLDKPGWVLFIYCVVGFCVEAYAFYAAAAYHNNMAVYSIYSLLEFGLICVYFNYSIDVFLVNNSGLIFGSVGMLLGILNLMFLQPPKVLNSYFLYFEGIVVIGLSLFAFFRMLLVSADVQVHHLRSFWFPAILCFFWSITFFNWGLYEYFLVAERAWIWLIDVSINLVSGITYAAIALLLWYYPKLKPTNE